MPGATTRRRRADITVTGANRRFENAVWYITATMNSPGSEESYDP
jgi:hypothetical protein